MAAITRTPTGKVTNHTAPKLVSGYTYETTWKVPSDQTRDSNHRAETVHVWMRLVWGSKVNSSGGGGSASERIQVEYTNSLGATTRSTNFANFTDNKGKRYTRSSFYPLTSRTLTGITSHVRLHNRKGNGAWHDSTITLLAPNKPTVGSFSFNSSTGTTSITITAAETEERRERYDTQYTLDVQLKKNGQSLRSLKSDTVAFTGDEREVTYDYSGYQQLGDGEYVLITLTAKSRGWAGDSGAVTRRFVVGPPKVPTIGEPAVTSNGPNGRVSVPVGIALDYAMKTVNGATERDYSINPVTGVVLQALVDVTYANVSDIPAASVWDDVAEDNGNVTVVTADVGDVAPSTGKYSYVRLMSYHFVKGVAALRRYSAIKPLAALHRDVPTVSDDQCTILSVEQDAAAGTALVTIGYDPKSGTRDNSDGTELSWSDMSDAWTSTEQPETFEVTWKTSTDGTQWSSDWHYYQQVRVRDLEDGRTYYFKARRYKDEDDSFGDYSNAASLAMASAPASVEVSAPSVVGVGDGLSLSWMHSGDLQQRGWMVMSGDAVLASGSGSTQTTTIAADRYEPYVTDGVVQMRVLVSTGGDYTASEPFSAFVADPPELGISMSPITAQPVSLGLSCDIPNVTVALVLTSEGVGGDGPSGETYQERGDDVWSDVVIPDWQLDEVTGTYAATVELPPSLRLVDGALYTITARATDTTTLLESEEVTAQAVVTWAHQAPEPPDGIVVTPSDVVDEDGMRTISATVQMVAAQGMDDEDVYDLYRVTPSGADLIAEGVAPTDAVTDPYAPFGNATLAYRVVTRTADGDIDWADYPYELLSAPVTDGMWMRVDFGGQYVELEHVELSDRFTKSFERRTHFGERTGQGYFGDSVEHGAGATAAVLRVYDQATIDALSDLNAYVGPCLVRTSDGRCYEANVTASTIGQSSSSGGYVVTLDMEEVALTDYMAYVEEA